MGNWLSRLAHYQRSTDVSYSCVPSEPYSDQDSQTDSTCSIDVGENDQPEWIRGNRREFEEGIDIFIDFATLVAEPLLDRYQYWSSSWVEENYSGWAFSLDSSVVPQLIKQLDQHCSPKRDIQLLINVLKLIHMTVQVCFAVQIIYDQILADRFTEDDLVWLSRLWISHDDQTVIEWMDAIFRKLWYLHPYNRMLIKIIENTFTMTSERNIIRYISIGTVRPYPCDFWTSTDNVLDVFPQITTNMYRMFSVLLNSWRLSTDSSVTSDWCEMKCASYLDLVRRILTVKLEPAHIGRLLRIATYAFTRIPNVKPIFFLGFKNLFNLLTSHERLHGFSTKELSYYFMSTHELHAILIQLRHQTHQSSKDLEKILERVIKENENLEPLRRTDLDLFSLPDIVVECVSSFTGDELCFEPNIGCRRMLESNQHRLRIFGVEVSDILLNLSDCQLPINS